MYVHVSKGFWNAEHYRKFCEIGFRDEGQKSFHELSVNAVKDVDDQAAERVSVASESLKHWCGEEVRWRLVG